MIPLILIFLSFHCPSVSAVLRITGSSTIYPIVSDAKTEFEQQSGVRIDLHGGGSEVGIAAILAGNADLALVSRELLPSDDPRLQNYPIASDGIALIVHSSIPVSALTSSQVVSIYSGKVTNWQWVGGDDREITVIAKHEGHGTKTRFDNYFGLQDRITENAFLFDSNIESIAMVASDPSAIGYVSIGSAEHAINLKLRIRLLQLNGIEASSQNIARGTYPLRRTLNLVIVGSPTEDAMRFIQYMRSDKGQAFVKKNHFVTYSQERH